MAGKIITLKFDANCADCGAFLSAGSKAKWYGRGRVYGLECHSATRTKGFRPGEPLGQTLSRLDRYGVYSVDGQKIGVT